MSHGQPHASSSRNSPPYGSFYNGSGGPDSKPDLSNMYSDGPMSRIDPSLQSHHQMGPPQHYPQQGGQNGMGQHPGMHSHNSHSSMSGSPSMHSNEPRSRERDIDSLLNGVGFASVQSGEPKYMGSSSGSESPPSLSMLDAGGH